MTRFKEIARIGSLAAKKRFSPVSRSFSSMVTPESSTQEAQANKDPMLIDFRIDCHMPLEKHNDIKSLPAFLDNNIAQYNQDTFSTITAEDCILTKPNKYTAADFHNFSIDCRMPPEKPGKLTYPPDFKDGQVSCIKETGNFQTLVKGSAPTTKART